MQYVCVCVHLTLDRIERECIKYPLLLSMSVVCIRFDAKPRKKMSPAPAEWSRLIIRIYDYMYASEVKINMRVLFIISLSAASVKCCGIALHIMIILSFIFLHIIITIIIAIYR